MKRDSLTRTCAVGLGWSLCSNLRTHHDHLLRHHERAHVHVLVDGFLALVQTAWDEGAWPEESEAHNYGEAPRFGLEPLADETTLNHDLRCRLHATQVDDVEGHAHACLRGSRRLVGGVVDSSYLRAARGARDAADHAAAAKCAA